MDPSSVRLGLKFVLLDLRSDFSKNLLFFVFQGESWFSRFSGRDLISVFETNLNLVRIRVSPYLCVWKRTELATNFLHESDKFVSSSLVLLAPEWTVVKIALSPWSHRRVPRHTSTTFPCLCRRIHPGRSLQKSLRSRSCRAAWAHLEPQCGVNTCVKVHEKICGVRVFCSHLPSVTVAINGKRNQLWQKREIRAKKLWVHFRLRSDACHHEELGDEGQYCHPDMLVNSIAEVIFGENQSCPCCMRLCSTWMGGLFNWFSWFVV